MQDFGNPVGSEVRRLLSQRGTLNGRLFRRKRDGFFFDTELGKIANPRLKQMLDKCLPYNLTFHYIKGEENCVADYGSRKPRSVHDGDKFKICNPIIQHRSRKVYEKYFDVNDPKVECIAELGEMILNTKGIMSVSVRGVQKGNSDLLRQYSEPEAPYLK